MTITMMKLIRSNQNRNRYKLNTEHESRLTLTKLTFDLGEFTCRNSITSGGSRSSQKQSFLPHDDIITSIRHIQIFPPQHARPGQNQVLSGQLPPHYQLHHLSLPRTWQKQYTGNPRPDNTRTCLYLDPRSQQHFWKQESNLDLQENDIGLNDDIHIRRMLESGEKMGSWRIYERSGLAGYP